MQKDQKEKINGGQVFVIPHIVYDLYPSGYILGYPVLLKEKNIRCMMCRERNV